MTEKKFLEIVAFAAADVDDHGPVWFGAAEDGFGGIDLCPRSEVVFGVALHGSVEIACHGGVGGEILEEVVGCTFAELPVGFVDVNRVLVVDGGEEVREGTEHGVV